MGEIVEFSRAPSTGGQAPMGKTEASSDRYLTAAEHSVEALRSIEDFCRVGDALLTKLSAADQATDMIVDAGVREEMRLRVATQRCALRLALARLKQERDALFQASAALRMTFTAVGGSSRENASRA